MIHFRFLLLDILQQISKKVFNFIYLNQAILSRKTKDEKNNPFGSCIFLLFRLYIATGETSSRRHGRSGNYHNVL